MPDGDVELAGKHFDPIRITSCRRHIHSRIVPDLVACSLAMNTIEIPSTSRGRASRSLLTDPDLAAS